MDKIVSRFIYSIIFLIITFIMSICLIYSKNNSLIGIIIMSILTGFIIYIHKVLSRLGNRINDKVVKIIFACSMMLILIVQLICAYKLAVIPSWDFGQVYRQAIKLAENPSSPISTYFAVYPNNIGLLYILTSVYKLLNLLNIKHYLIAGIIVNIIFIDLSIILLYLSCKKLFGKKQSIIFFIMSIMFLPYYLYIPVFYTDTISMFFISVIVYCFISFEKTKSVKQKILYIIIIGLASAAGVKIKATIAIVLMAIIIYFIIKIALNRKIALVQIISVIVLLAIFAGGIKTTNHIIDKTIYIDNEALLKYKFPYEHWIMMGLKGKAFYDEDDVQYTASRGNYDEKRSAATEMIKERVNNYGVYGLTKHIVRKSVFTWEDGTYYAPHCLKKAVNTNVLHEFFTEEGRYYSIYYYYSYGYQLMLLALLLISIIKNIKYPEINLEMVLHMAVAGLIIFFFIWENCPRYVLHFMGIVILIDCNAFSPVKRKRQ